MDEITVALISLSVSTIVSMVLNLLVYSQNKQKHYSTTISKERMAWIKVTRKIAADFIAFCESHESIDEDSKQEFFRLKNLLLLNLNTDKKYENDVVIRLYLENLSFEEIKKNIPGIRTAFADIFKNEWDKAKLESGRSKYYVKKLDKINRDLREYYSKNHFSTII
ncbi:MAG: hypothetical protein E7573_02265 [Ruminococcaceae bacterium]|nr:hypothetical protein [Oscillospiraceae bacterium]MBR3596207.1 hypothetical protein [Clostridia bacterium]